MRLIDTTTGELSYFMADIPPYAILSHTWVPGEEMSLREYELTFTSGHDSRTSELIAKLKLKSGYGKIQKCLRLAKSQGIEWAWIDTCSIDKTSSAELSEAINSMFKWYKNADVCYVYLEDVHVVGSALKDLNLLDVSHDFYQTKWFTRGWTLQELIAPLNLQFYSSDWDFIATKSAIADILTRATGIPTEALLNGTTSRWSVSQRMSWAAHRTTTRTEDMAYCLLGLFDLQMPMLYGEGSKAFIRLQEQIAATIEDHSIFAWQASGNTMSPQDKISNHRGLFARHPSEFADGRLLSPNYTDLSRSSIQWGLMSKGFHLNLPLISWKEAQELPDALSPFRIDGQERVYDTPKENRDVVAVLSCRRELDYVGIWLTPLGNDNRFARVRVHELVYLTPKMPRSFFDGLKEHAKDVWVNNLSNLSQLYSSARTGGLYLPRMSSKLESEMIVISRPDTWNPKKRTIRNRGSTMIRNGGWLATIVFPQFFAPRMIIFGYLHGDSQLAYAVLDSDQARAEHDYQIDFTLAKRDFGLTNSSGTVRFILRDGDESVRYNCEIGSVVVHDILLTRFTISQSKH
ncbi:HET-domain-containing protein [Microthyrium microscopicum]|uniref:HET-domain-containing protein n=1 Tax=Microthyrium microscopicum TaxID=703497 RepID=A0A6A6TW95_9PEZI|nr:HET-domain-containing protein [Microthyrium microscopicum]